MMRDVRSHKADYSILAVIAGIFIVYFVQNRHDTRTLVGATVIFGIVYTAWGVWHHINIQSVTRHIVLEYFLVAICGVVIVCSLLL